MVQVFLEQWIFVYFVKKFPGFMEPEGLLPFWAKQVSYSVPYFSKIHQCILSSRLAVQSVVFSSDLLTKVL
jgi:hypothetical protein